MAARSRSGASHRLTPPSSPTGPSMECLAASQKELFETPRRQRQETINGCKTTDILTDVGRAMNPDMVIYEAQDVLDHFFPPLPGDCKQEDIDAIKEELAGKLIDKKPSQPPCQSEKKTFEPLSEFAAKKRNRLVFRLVPDDIVESDVDGANFRMDGCFKEPNSTRNRAKSTKGRSRSKSREDSSKLTRGSSRYTTRRSKSTQGPSESTGEGSKSKVPRDSLHATSIIVPMEFKVKRNFDMIRQNRLQVCSGVSHIMNDDVRRMFMLAITIEDDRMTLWYFSRSLSVKSKSFNYVQNKEFLIQVLISLMFATDEELGLDPRVQIRPQEDPKSPRQYIYEFPNEAGSKFFATTESISDYRTLYVSGRKTRVFKVVEVEKEGACWREKGEATPMVLKDVWLDDGAKTEKDIQNELFENIQRFADRPDWKSDPRLQAFNSPQTQYLVKNLDSLLQDGNYKSLFLLIHAETTGEPSKPLGKGAYFPNPEVFYSRSAREEGSAMYSRTSRQTPGVSAKSRNRNVRPEADEEVEPTYRAFGPKRRSFLFSEECTPVDRLPTVGDAFSVLSQCITALLLMFCAGWVHRDISAGNVMAVQDVDGGWKLKLADLEYAKQFSEGMGSSDPKTGTPFFMAHEILARRYVIVGRPTRVDLRDEFSDEETDTDHNPIRKADAQDATPKSPLRHNFQHDLESVFWIALWVITRRVGHLPSRRYARTIFTNSPNLHLTPARGDAFTEAINGPLSACLLEPLLPLADLLDQVRSYLYREAHARGEAKSWNDPSSYSNIFVLLAYRFTRMLMKPQEWAGVKLVPRDSPAGNPFVEDKIPDDEPSRVKMGPPSLPLKRSVPPGGGNGERRSKRGRLTNRGEGVPGPATSSNPESFPSTSRQTLSSRTQSDASERRSTRIQARRNSSTRSTRRK